VLVGWTVKDMPALAWDSVHAGFVGTAMQGEAAEAAFVSGVVAAVLLVVAATVVLRPAATATQEAAAAVALMVAAAAVQAAAVLEEEVVAACRSAVTALPVSYED